MARLNAIFACIFILLVFKSTNARLLNFEAKLNHYNNLQTSAHSVHLNNDDPKGDVSSAGLPPPATGTVGGGGDSRPPPPSAPLRIPGLGHSLQALTCLVLCFLLFRGLKMLLPLLFQLVTTVPAARGGEFQLVPPPLATGVVAGGGVGQLVPPPPDHVDDFRPTAPGHSPGVGHSIQN